MTVRLDIARLTMKERLDLISELGIAFRLRV